MKYYVYLYMREDMYSPYYVGKGSGRRCYSSQRRVKKPPNPNRIRKVFHTDSEEEAVEVEATLIKFYGRIQEGGVLLNRAERGRKKGSWNREQRKRAAAKRGSGVVVGGVYYLSRKEAQKALGVGWRSLDKLIRGDTISDTSFVLDSVRYSSISEASKILGVKWDTIKRWIQRGGNPNIKEVIFMGVEYKNTEEALQKLCEKYGITRRTAQNWLNNKQTPNTGFTLGGVYYISEKEAAEKLGVAVITIARRKSKEKST